MRQALHTSLLLLCTSLIHVGEAGAQRWSIQESDAPQRWRLCRISAPAYAGPCGVTVISRGDKAINIHFDRDASGVEGLSFVIAANALQLEERMAFGLVAERFGRNAISSVTGQCAFRRASIRCVSRDGRFSAEAVEPLP